jgi:copper homeostasis protein CutC
VLLEVVCCSPEDVTIAEASGADRIELCCAIELGGLTPSLGLMRACRRSTRLPIVAMIRPHARSFEYDEMELDAMAADIRTARREDMDGVVFGVLEGIRIADTNRQLIESAAGLQKVFHRAFDRSIDSPFALESMGFDRVLTSGRADCALNGTESLKAWRGGRLEILAGGGIRADCVEQVARLSGCDQIHLGPFKDGRLNGHEVRRVADILSRIGQTDSAQ